ncbi:hypothetical protein D3C87_755030 [compost metagenome]
MFDDDTSYLEACAREISKYGLTVMYPYERCILAVHKSYDEHIVGIIRKRTNIPFYQAFLIQLLPTNENYLKLVQDNLMIPYVFENRDKVQNFVAVDISGHENFQNEFIRELKERFR